ncbi:hypothetical protein HYW41_05245 [Candidatus Daviesbacteria bacterium]|nr:hypothetical protein [Candidatus Daviesbacteria bacterium]
MIVLTGKTASGKDTIAYKLLLKYPLLKRVITTTSRIPRKDETNGKDYYFLTREEFNEKIKNGEFAEYVGYGGNLYGTFKKELEQALISDTLWRIDPSRAGEVREFIKRTFPSGEAQDLIQRVVVIYITTADKVILERLKNRGLSESEIIKRMNDDNKIWQKYSQKYDFVVENAPGRLDQTLNKIISILGSNPRG